MVLRKLNVKYSILLILVFMFVVMLISLHFSNQFINFSNTMRDIKHSVFNDYLEQGIISNLSLLESKTVVRSTLRFLRIKSILVMALMLVASLKTHIKRGYRALEPLFTEAYDTRMYILSRMNFGKYKDGGLLQS
ncbi:MAG: hypothetical protein AB7G87_13225 [Clostridia bacterium]